MARRVRSRTDELFLNAWFQLIYKGHKATSLKYALAHALLGLADEHSPTTSPLQVGIQDLTQRFVSYYWLQATRDGLHQALTERMEPKFYFLLRQAATAPDSPARVSHDLPRTILHELEQSGFKELLPRFHRLPARDGAVAPCQFYTATRRGIEISAEAHDFLARHAQVLQPGVLLEWARWLERCNPTTPGIVEKLTQSVASSPPYRMPSRSGTPKAEPAELIELIDLLSSLAGEQERPKTFQTGSPKRALQERPPR